MLALNIVAILLTIAIIYVAIQNFKPEKYVYNVTQADEGAGFFYPASPHTLPTSWSAVYNETCTFSFSPTDNIATQCKCTQSQGCGAPYACSCPLPYKEQGVFSEPENIQVFKFVFNKPQTTMDALEFVGSAFSGPTIYGKAIVASMDQLCQANAAGFNPSNNSPALIYSIDRQAFTLCNNQNMCLQTAGGQPTILSAANPIVYDASEDDAVTSVFVYGQKPDPAVAQLFTKVGTVLPFNTAWDCNS